ncbi:hypothetical protein [Salinisphaera sp. Q1T1-3]|uniref:PilZ domain-containing protein n=1 Tax=Salinisphaera sp. Q1T1-3 TaxID=2321229 RepID=UPI000E7130A3|nr:hypothetical protein [Salinisphaera sp. Q1T1-3]RJS95098.1 hypothetical protein D3260_00625 [Salinisphaera sp. Q1T1-3]
MNQQSESAVNDGTAVQIEIEEIASLEAAFMPFIRNGGLFIDQSQLGDAHYEFGAALPLVLHVRATGERIAMTTRVVWLAPTRGQRRTGIGIQFSETEGPDIRRRVMKPEAAARR